MTEADFLWNDAWTVDRDSSAEVLQLFLDHLFVKLRKSLLAGEVPKMRSTDKIMSEDYQWDGPFKPEILWYRDSGFAVWDCCFANKC